MHACPRACMHARTQARRTSRSGTPSTAPPPPRPTPRTRRNAGVIKSSKMVRTIIVRRDYLHYIPKYARCVASSPSLRVVWRSSG